MPFKKLLTLVAAMSLVGCGGMTASKSIFSGVNAEDADIDTRIGKTDRPLCEINPVEYGLDAKMVSFEMTGSTGMHVGFDLLSGFVKAIGVSFQAKSGKMTMAFSLFEPLTPGTELVGVVGAGTFYDWGVNLDVGFNAIGAGFGIFNKTPLAKLAQKSLADSFENLTDQMRGLQDSWSTIVVSMPDDYSVIIPVGSYSGLKIGDLFAVYNVVHEWAGTACFSDHLIARKTTPKPLAIGQVTQIGKNGAVLHLLDDDLNPRNTTEDIEIGAKVYVQNLPGKNRTLYRSMQIRNVIGAEMTYENGAKVDLSPHMKDQINAVANSYNFIVHQ
jgi:hypothetical protein